MQNFLLTIEDDVERKVCCMYMRGCRDGAVCGQLGISKERLAEIKAEIRRRMIAAGIRAEA